MDLSVVLARQKLSLPIMNGAGSCKHIEDVKLLASTDLLGGINVGSGTVNKGSGNAGNVFDWNQYRSLNSLGLPNPGKEEYRELLPEMVEIAHDSGKVLHFTIAGNTPDDYAQMAEVARDANVDCLEVNLGCPNKFASDKRQMRIIAFLPDQSQQILRLVRQTVGPGLTMAVKVTYYSDRGALEEVADSINDPSLVQVVVTTNTLPNCVAFTADGKHLIVPQYKGYAGGAGRMMKEAALGQVQMWRSVLRPEIQIEGVGGIATGRDVVEFFWAGADSVQITSELLKKNKLDITPLSGIVSELTDLAHLVPQFADRMGREST